MVDAPSFWKERMDDPDKIGVRRTPDLIRARKEGLADAHKFTSWDKDTIKTMLVGIDWQNDFMDHDEATLGVVGARVALRNQIDMIVAHAHEISGLLFSLDKHLPYQIFYPLWWWDKNGNHPDPYTPILESDVMSGRWIPRMEKDWSRQYPAKLIEEHEQFKKKFGAIAGDPSPLLIWPEHCMIGSDGSTMVADLAEIVMWLSAARNIQPMYMFKGTVPKSEHYGAYCCCVSVSDHPQGSFQTPFLDIQPNYNRIIYGGIAGDFCLLETQKQHLMYFGDKDSGAYDPDTLKKTVFLTDCTALVFPDKTTEWENKMQTFADHGIQIAKSTDPWK